MVQGRKRQSKGAGASPGPQAQVQGSKGASARTHISLASSEIALSLLLLSLASSAAQQAKPWALHSCAKLRPRYLIVFTTSSDNWDEFLPALEFAYNNSLQKSTDKTPFYLTYGMHPRTPATVLSQQIPGTKSLEANAFIADLQAALADAK
jgi:hypothetical protein